MAQSKRDRSLNLKSNTELAQDISAFLTDRQAGGVSPRTVRIYGHELRFLREYLEGNDIECVESIKPTHLREYMLHLSGWRNPGGVHVAYRVCKTFLRWWEDEMEPDNWRNPISKVKPPKVPQKALDPVPIEDLKTILTTCERKTFVGDRDRAIFLTLLDTGLRAAEFLSLNISDVDLKSGAVQVRSGKGGKSRIVFLGAKGRREVNRYLRHRQAEDDVALRVTVHGTRLTYDGLRQILRRRAKQAQVPEPTLHDFRRAFALYSLRNGADVYTIQRLMGHADLTVLHRYLKQTDDDLQAVHSKSAPVDHLL